MPAFSPIGGLFARADARPGVIVDTTPPTLLSAVVSNSTPGRIDLTWSEAINPTISAASAFTVNAGHAITAHTYLDLTHSYLTTSTNFVNGEAARTLAYTQPGSNNMQDSAGNLLANFSGAAITNNVAGSSNITSSVLLSRTGAADVNGVAPFVVHIDCTGTTSSDPTITSLSNGGTFRNILHSVNWGDSGSGTWLRSGLSKNTHSGAGISVHVYETPGTWPVNVTHSAAGTADKVATTQNVTVSDPATVYSGTNTIVVYGVTNDITGGPAGATYVSTFTGPSAGKRVLFKRGVNHTLGGSLSGVNNARWDAISTTGVIGAGGSGSKPYIQSFNQFTGSNTVISNMRSKGGFQHYLGQNFHFFNCDADTPTSNEMLTTHSDPWTATKYTGFIECTADGTGGNSGSNLGSYGFFGKLIYACFMGGYVNQEQQHCVRSTNSYKAAIQHNYLPGNGPDGSKHAIKCHAQNTASGTAWDEVSSATDYVTEKLVISYNRLGSVGSTKVWTCATDSQNATPEALQDVMVENNVFTRGVSTPPNDMVMGGRRMTSRGNTSTNDTIIIATGVNGIVSGFDGPYFNS